MYVFMRVLFRKTYIASCLSLIDVIHMIDVICHAFFRRILEHFLILTLGQYIIPTMI